MLKAAELQLDHEAVSRVTQEVCDSLESRLAYVTKTTYSMVHDSQLITLMTTSKVLPPLTVQYLGL